MTTRQSAHWQDGAFVLFTVTAALLLCRWFSAHRIFWSDELFGWMLLADPSLHHMLSAWRAGADGGGVLFYILGRGWFDIFGPSELSFRCFSALGEAGGAIAVWFAARRFYPPWLLATILLTIWFGTQVTLDHLIEGRFYGMLLGSTGLAYLAAVRAWSGDRTSTGALLFLFAANLLLCGSHPFGFVYSAALLCGMLLLDRAQRHLRWRNYLAATAAGALVLAVSQQALRNTAEVGKPHFWTSRPRDGDLSQAYLLQSRMVHDLLLAGAVLLVVVLAVRWLSMQDLRRSVSSRRVLLLPATTLGLCPLVIFLASRHGTSVFVPRYLLPFDIALAIGMVELWTLILSSARLPAYGKQLLGAGFFLVCLVGSFRVWRPFREQLVVPPLDIVKPLVALLPANLPTVVERADVADLIWAYAPARRAGVFFLLDWQNALAPESPRGDVSGFHELQTWKRLGWFSGSIVDSAAFLASTNKFVVVDAPREMWFDRRILGDPTHWSVTQLAHFHPQNEVEQKNWGATVWLVERRAATLPTS